MRASVLADIPRPFSWDGTKPVGSIVGMLLVGLLANTEVNPAIAGRFHSGGVLVSLGGGIRQLGNHTIVSYEIDLRS